MAMIKVDNLRLVWNYLAVDGKVPDTMAPVLMAYKDMAGKLRTAEGWCNEGVWHDGIRALSSNEIVYAWANIPIPPEFVDPKGE